MNVVQYDIHIWEINFAAQHIKAFTNIKLTADSANTDTLNLSLLQFTVDSVITNGQALPFIYNDTTLSIIPVQALNPGDTIELQVHYEGNPPQDPSGWGGFYFTGNFMFNMGVGFESDPHNFGRAWFPCVDNFTDRAVYTFHIRTPGNMKAFCNGLLTGQVLNPDGTIFWHWEMSKTIPTYLASVAVAPYYTWQRNSNNIPVEIACLPSDSNKVAQTFQNLDSVLSSYITAYGPYPFEKVGYCLIPFGSGAMEHAGSIHIGSAFVNGTLTYETLWAHELAHMWWGDHVTCETEGDMWLNEGFASFNEHFITEKLYGNTAYRDLIRSTHRNVLQFAHLTDNSYLSLANVPHEYTYGPTVYSKGAGVARTLRHFMGDDLFFEGCRDYFSNLGGGHANSFDLRDQLASSSGMQMNDFFNDWVFTPGFPHFSIDTVIYQPGGLDHYFIHTRQKSKGNNHVYKMNVDITFSDGVQDTTVTVTLDSATNVIHVPLLFANAQWICIDRYDKMADAITDYERQISATGVNAFPETNVSLNVQSFTGLNTTVRIEHNWVTPDSFQYNPGIRLSDYHYWTVDGIFDSGLQSKATFTYNGSLSMNNGHLDNALITGTEDSLIILYRQHAKAEWQIVNGFTRNIQGNANDKIGSITIDTLKHGQYTFGYYDYTLTGMQDNPNKKSDYLQIWPNPSKTGFNIRINDRESRDYSYIISDMQGRKVNQGSFEGKSIVQWKPDTSGSYTFSLYRQNQLISTEKLISF